MPFGVWRDLKTGENTDRIYEKTNFCRYGCFVAIGVYLLAPDSEGQCKPGKCGIL